MSTINKTSSCMKVKCFKMPNASYTNRYAQAFKIKTSNEETDKKVYNSFNYCSYYVKNVASNNFIILSWTPNK